MDEESLDPDDWAGFRAQAHRMLDDMCSYLETIRTRPVWQPMQAQARAPFRSPMPAEGRTLADVHQQFMTQILPHTVGNPHPAFFGWVHGGGTPVGMLAEMLAAGLNVNLGGRDQIPLEVERQVVRWMADLFDFPEGASGVLVTGSSMANLLALLVARHARLGDAVRQHGLVAYAASTAHGCIAQALEASGLGRASLRIIPVNEHAQIQLPELQRAIRADRAAGLTPFFVVATAGTVDVGAVDDLAGVAAIAREEQLWFHVDGAYGALGMLAPPLRPLLQGIQQADSVACDFHKWGQVPYDAGLLLVRDGAAQLAAFSAADRYLRRDLRGMAANSPWPCDLGLDLSRGFRALKVWMTLQVHGADKLGRTIYQTCQLAQYLAERVRAQPQLELLAPVTLNIVCFRYRDHEPTVNALNAALVVAVQESGLAAPSLTSLDGQLAIRCAIVNHRTQARDIDALLAAVLSCGAQQLFERHAASR
ncbi:pyridoxal-dependent decarboxylase [Duganella sp. CY15W]|uniref:pyridoxal phosphate-dependent decarboxylase family protein n=1 Tax=Duganella sp. CY15W TaxID=2692172 RepID=UPI001E312DEC|nr:pyridoxal-dependent decarboxylase [Duganella sp. CY15W]